jgi:hypothetical protein
MKKLYSRKTLRQYKIIFNKQSFQDFEQGRDNIWYPITKDALEDDWEDEEFSELATKIMFEL